MSHNKRPAGHVDVHCTFTCGVVVGAASSSASGAPIATNCNEQKTHTPACTVEREVCLNSKRAGAAVAAVWPGTLCEEADSIDSPPRPILLDAARHHARQAAAGRETDAIVVLGCGGVVGAYGGPRAQAVSCVARPRKCRRVIRRAGRRRCSRSPAPAAEEAAAAAAATTKTTTATARCCCFPTSRRPAAERI